MKKLLQYTGSIVGGALAPLAVAFAAPRNFQTLVSQIIDLFNAGTVVLFSLAILAFFWSVARNMWGYDSSNAEQQKKLTQTLTWGVLIIFVMVSIWGIIAILQQTLSGGLQ